MRSNSVLSFLAVEGGQTSCMEARVGQPSMLTAMFQLPPNMDRRMYRTIRPVRKRSGLSRYRINSDSSWLAASPQEWTHTGPGETEITATVNSASLLPGTHKGKLEVVRVEGQNQQEDGTPLGAYIPVALAVMPSSSTNVPAGILGAVERGR